jgi:hypothetical protein
MSISRSTLNTGFVPLPTCIYRNSRENMLRQVKTLKMRLTRTPEWKEIQREELLTKIMKLIQIREDMKEVIKKAEGL